MSWDKRHEITGDGVGPDGDYIVATGTPAYKWPENGGCILEIPFVVSEGPQQGRKGKLSFSPESERGKEQLYRAIKTYTPDIFNTAPDEETGLSAFITAITNAPVLITQKTKVFEKNGKEYVNYYIRSGNNSHNENQTAAPTTPQVQPQPALTGPGLPF